MTNKQIASFFNDLAALMELHEGDAFKVKSYRMAYNNLRRVPSPLSSLSFEERAKIKGVGKAINEKIEDLLTTGKVVAYERLLKDTPDGIVEMLKMKGFGPKKIRTVWRQLGVETVSQLLQACNEDKVIALKGFAKKSQEDLKQKLKYHLASKGKFRFSVIYEAAQELKALLLKSGLSNIEETGILRRRDNTTEKIEFITDDNWTIDSFEDFIVESVDEVLVAGVYKELYPVEITLTTSERFILDWFYTSGSDDFLESIEVDEDEYEDEEELFEAIELPYIEPELREVAVEEIKGSSLVEVSDIKGIIHAHSTYSDGMHTLEEMAIYCAEQKMQYLAITDHSQAAFYANGLQPERVALQHQEIDEINHKNPDFKIYKGIEVDILSDGSLDYDDATLNSFEFTIASIHSGLSMNEEKAMNRLIKAIEHPRTHMLGHMTGRLVLAREGYPVDHQKVIDACAANDVAIEINANPYRLDIDWRWVDTCIEKGVLLSINPDAHQKEGIHDVLYGTMVARKGGLSKEHCVCCFDRMQFDKWISRK